jgi:hypothetical protein
VAAHRLFDGRCITEPMEFAMPENVPHGPDDLPNASHSTSGKGGGSRDSAAAPPLRIHHLLGATAVASLYFAFARLLVSEHNLRVSLADVVFAVVEAAAMYGFVYVALTRLSLAPGEWLLLARGGDLLLGVLLNLIAHVFEDVFGFIDGCANIYSATVLTYAAIRGRVDWPWRAAYCASAFQVGWAPFTEMLPRSTRDVAVAREVVLLAVLAILVWNVVRDVRRRRPGWPHWLGVATYILFILQHCIIELIEITHSP